MEKAEEQAFVSKGSGPALVNILKTFAEEQLVHDDFLEVILEGLSQTFEDLEMSWFVLAFKTVG